MKTFDKTESIDIEDIEIEKGKIISYKNEPIKEKIAENNNITSNSPQATIESSVTSSKVINNSLDDHPLDNIVNNDFQEKTIIRPSLNSIGIAADHRGYKKKQKLTKYLTKIGYNVIDFGGNGIKGDDYTEFGFKLGEAIKSHEIEKGIAICGSGIGISMACNKVDTVRCAKVNNTKEAKWAKKDNDANIIAISAKMPLYRAKDIIDMYLKTKFSGAERHQRRIDLLNNYK